VGWRGEEEQRWKREGFDGGDGFITEVIGADDPTGVSAWDFVAGGVTVVFGAAGTAGDAEARFGGEVYVGEESGASKDSRDSF